MRIGAMRNATMRSVVMGLSLTMVLAACGDDNTGGGGSPTAQDSPTQAASMTESAGADAATVDTASSDLGTILVDAEGNTLYLFEADTDGSSTCYQDCAATWPALVADTPVAGSGIDDSLLGTTERDDGSMQVTYADHPLYHYAPDTSPGDTSGQGVGDVWFVVSPKGEAVTDKAATGPGY
jgi:predicted lipoprotein with Yx(FWY)xxD motif